MDGVGTDGTLSIPLFGEGQNLSLVLPFSFLKCPSLELMLC